MLPGCYPRDVLLARIATKQGDAALAVEHLARACRLDAAATIELAAQAPELAALLRALSQSVEHTSAAAAIEMRHGLAGLWRIQFHAVGFRNLGEEIMNKPASIHRGS